RPASSTARPAQTRSSHGAAGAGAPKTVVPGGLSVPFTPGAIAGVLPLVAGPRDLQRPLGGGLVRVRPHPVPEPALPALLGPLMLQAVVPPFSHDSSIPLRRADMPGIRDTTKNPPGCLPGGFRGGQGRDRTGDLPLFRRTLVPTELPGRRHPYRMPCAKRRISPALTCDPDGTRTRALRRDRAAR